MTITYPDGTVRNALVLSHKDLEIRAIAAGGDDVMVFTRLQDTWFSEDLEEVTFEFEWQHRVAPPAGSEDEFVCPKELAERLLSLLFGNGDPDPSDADRLHVLGPEGTRIAIHRTDLVVN